HIIGTNGQLPVSPVDHATKLYTARATVIHQRIHRRTDRTSGIEYIVQQHNIAVIQVEGNFRDFNLRHFQAGPEIIAIEGDIQHAKINLIVELLPDHLHHAPPHI